MRCMAKRLQVLNRAATKHTVIMVGNEKRILVTARRKEEEYGKDYNDNAPCGNGRR